MIICKEKEQGNKTKINKTFLYKELGALRNLKLVTFLVIPLLRKKNLVPNRIINFKKIKINFSNFRFIFLNLFI